jgi:soluble lytic murein transglycosylase-like protein
MMRNERASDQDDTSLLRLRSPAAPSRDHPGPRTIVIRHGSTWQSLAFLCLALLLLVVILIGQQVVRGIDAQNQQAAAAMARVELKIQQLESGIAFDSRRRHLLLGMRDHILRTNPRVSLGDAYRYAELAMDATEKYPTVDPLFLLAIGIVESRYDTRARSPADARGLYQIWPSTGRLLLRALGWDYEETSLYDPEKNTLVAALYLDILFATYNDPQMVLAEYNGGPVNAGFFRAGASQLAAETRNYVPHVLETYARLKEEFEKGMELRVEEMHRSRERQAKRLGERPRGEEAQGTPAIRSAKAAPSGRGTAAEPAENSVARTAR